jgi:hypothetical protein
MAQYLLRQSSKVNIVVYVSHDQWLNGLPEGELYLLRLVLENLGCKCNVIKAVEPLNQVL